MTARGWAALLLLLAVVTAHALQCTAADGGAAPVPPIAMVAFAGPAAGDDHPANSGHLAAPPATDHAVATASVFGGAHDTAPGHAAGHLWTVCLAVLAAGLAVLLLLLEPRSVHLAPAALTRALGRAAGSLPLPRPPDLHALCLQRT
jgi:hypothetical protein